MVVPINYERKKYKSPEEVLDSALPDQILISVIDPDFEKRYKE